MFLATYTVEWSKETYRLFGVGIGTPISYDTFLNYVHPDDRRGIEAFVQQAIARAPIDEHRFRIVVVDELKWIHSITDFEYDLCGTLRFMFGTSSVVMRCRVTCIPSHC